MYVLWKVLLVALIIPGVVPLALKSEIMDNSKYIQTVQHLVAKEPGRSSSWTGRCTHTGSFGTNFCDKRN
jgi:hypothetical protein